MTKSFKKFVLITITAGFLLNAVNIPLLIHLAEHQSDKNHDHDKCPVCQQAAVNKNKAVIPNITAILELPQIIFTNINKSQTVIKGFRFLTPYLRAPPAIA